MSSVSASALSADDARWIVSVVRSLASKHPPLQEKVDALTKPMQVNVGWPRGNRGMITHTLEETSDAWLVQVHTLEADGEMAVKAVIAYIWALNGGYKRMPATFWLPIKELLPVEVAFRGPYPHKLPLAPVRKGSRLLKAQCELPSCGYNVNGTMKWFDQGLPYCGIHRTVRMKLVERDERATYGNTIKPPKE